MDRREPGSVHRDNRKRALGILGIYRLLPLHRAEWFGGMGPWAVCPRLPLDSASCFLGKCSAAELAVVQTGRMADLPLCGSNQQTLVMSRWSWLCWPAGCKNYAVMEASTKLKGSAGQPDRPASGVLHPVPSGASGAGPLLLRPQKGRATGSTQGQPGKARALPAS